MGISARTIRDLLFGDIESRLVGILPSNPEGSLNFPSMLRIEAAPLIVVTGRLAMRLIVFRIQSDARKLPRCGVEIKTTRLTKGRGSIK